MNKIKEMDAVFYLTIISGLLAVILSGVTYYNGKQKEEEADKANEMLLMRTNEVAALQKTLMIEMEKNQVKSDSIISIQEELQAANEKILFLSSENVKQVLGFGSPALTAHFYPDNRVALYIANDNDYPIYDINLNFFNPDHTDALKKMQTTNSNLSWEDMRKQLIQIKAFNLPPKTSFDFYSFDFPELMTQTTCFLIISSRHQSFSGLIIIKRSGDSFTYESEVKDTNGNLLSSERSK